MISTFQIKCSKQNGKWKPAACMLCEHFTCSRMQENLSKKSWCGWIWGCEHNRDQDHHYHYNALWQTYLCIQNKSMSGPLTVVYEDVSGQLTTV